MSAAENKALVAKIFEELREGKRRALLGRTAEDSIWTLTGTSPVSGVYHSRSDFYKLVLNRVTARLIGQVHPTVTHLHAEGDTVIVEWGGEPSTPAGVPYNNSYCWVLVMRDGLIREGRIYADTALIEELFRN